MVTPCIGVGYTLPDSSRGVVGKFGQKYREDAPIKHPIDNRNEILFATFQRFSPRSDLIVILVAVYMNIND